MFKDVLSCNEFQHLGKHYVFELFVYLVLWFIDSI